MENDNSARVIVDFLLIFFCRKDWIENRKENALV